MNDSKPVFAGIRPATRDELNKKVFDIIANLDMTIVKDFIKKNYNVTQFSRMTMVDLSDFIEKMGKAR